MPLPRFISNSSRNDTNRFLFHRASRPLGNRGRLGRGFFRGVESYGWHRTARGGSVGEGKVCAITEDRRGEGRGKEREREREEILGHRAILRSFREREKSVEPSCLNSRGWQSVFRDLSIHSRAPLLFLARVHRRIKRRD